MNRTTGTLDLPARPARKQPRVEPIWRFADVQPLCAPAFDAGGDQTATPVAATDAVDRSLVRLAFTRLCGTRGQQQPSARLLRVWGTD